MTTPIITLPPVQATGGKVTVMRTLAAASYGNYTVEYPDDVDPAYTPEGAREDGYVAALPVATRRRIGGLGRRFIRADLNVSAKDNTTDVEEKLDLAATRTEGDIYFETDIDETGLGRLIPDVDFTIGDWLNVLIWGLTIPGPVTKIERTTTNGTLTGWNIHIGGQLISDEDARRAANADSEAKLLQEQRERIANDQVVGKAAKDAQSTADDAQETASTIDEDLDRSAEVVAEELGLPSPAKAHRMEVITSETLAQAVEANTAVIGLAFPQESIVPTGLTGLPYWAVGSQSSTARPEVYEPPTDLSEYSFRPSGESSSSDRAFFTLSSRVDYKVSVWVRGDVGQRAYLSLVDEDGQLCLQQWQPWYPIPGSWVEAQRLEIAVVEPEGDPEEVVEPDEWTRHEWAVRLTPGTRRARLVVDDGGAAGTPWLNRLSVSVLNRPQEEVDRAQSEQIAENRRITAELKVVSEELGRIQNLLADSIYAYLSYTVTPVEAGTSWTELWSTTVAVPVTYTVYMRIGWQDATMVDEYGVSFHINGVRRGYFQERGLGPIIGGDYRVQARRWTNVRLEAGDTISFRVRSSASFGINRRIEDGLITLTQET